MLPAAITRDMSRTMLLLLCGTAIATTPGLPASRANATPVMHKTARQHAVPTHASSSTTSSVPTRSSAATRRMSSNTRAEDLVVSTTRRPFGFEKEQRTATASVNPSPEELTKRNIQSVNDLGKVAPGLQIQSTMAALVPVSVCVVSV